MFGYYHNNNNYNINNDSHNSNNKNNFNDNVISSQVLHFSNFL